MSDTTSKIYYSKTFFCRPISGALQETSLVLDGFVEAVEVREVNTAAGTKKVANMRLTATIPDSRVRSNFGESYVREDHKVYLRVAFWGMIAEAVEKAAYRQGTKLIVAIKNLAARSYTATNGKTYYYVEGTAYDFPQVERWAALPQDGQGVQQAPVRQTAPAQQAAPVAREISDFGDDVNDLFDQDALDHLDDDMPF